MFTLVFFFYDTCKYFISMTLFLVYLVLSTNCIVYASTNTQIVKKMPDSVVFETCCEGKQNKEWKFEDDFLFFNYIPMESRIRETVSLDANSSLCISAVSLLHIGIYQCICDSVPVKNFSLDVEGLSVKMI